jgi:hypothetical protein
VVLSLFDQVTSTEERALLNASWLKVLKVDDVIESRFFLKANEEDLELSSDIDLGVGFVLIRGVSVAVLILSEVIDLFTCLPGMSLLECLAPGL